MSDWRKRAVLCRDFRASNGEPAPPIPVTNAKKSTKKWCKGKVGIEHELELVDDPHWVGKAFIKKYTIDKLERCKNCGKHFNIYHAPSEFGGFRVHKIWGEPQPLPSHVYAAFEKEWKERYADFPQIDQ